MRTQSKHCIEAIRFDQSPSKDQILFLSRCNGCRRNALHASRNLLFASPAKLLACVTLLPRLKQLKPPRPLPTILLRQYAIVQSDHVEFNKVRDTAG
jgi:hypothetical protein